MLVLSRLAAVAAGPGPGSSTVVMSIRTRARAHLALQLQSSAAYFTNTDRLKADDPYAALGLTWGANSTDIKAAFRAKARELHPDVNTADKPEAALRKFQELKRAYDKLMDVRGLMRFGTTWPKSGRSEYGGAGISSPKNGPTLRGQQ